MLVKIEATSKQAMPLRGSQDQETLYTGLLIDGKWYNIRGVHQNLRGKTVDLEFNGSLCRFVLGPAPAQSDNGKGQPQLPLPQAVQRISLTKVLEAITRTYAVLPVEWAQDPGSSGAYASIIQSVIKGLNDGSFEVDAMAEPEPEKEPPSTEPWKG